MRFFDFQLFTKWVYKPFFAHLILPGVSTDRCKGILVTKDLRELVSTWKYL